MLRGRDFEGDWVGSCGQAFGLVAFEAVDVR